jgi:hypothetical protein
MGGVGWSLGYLHVKNLFLKCVTCIDQIFQYVVDEKTGLVHAFPDESYSFELLLLITLIPVVETCMRTSQKSGVKSPK